MVPVYPLKAILLIFGGGWVEGAGRRETVSAVLRSTYHANPFNTYVRKTILY